MHNLNRFLGLKRIPSALTGAALVALVPSTALAMDPFIDSSDLMQTEAANSGAPMAVADMNGDGLDDIVHLHRTRYLQIDYQQEDGTFVLGDEYDTMQGAWGMSVADVDGNGFNDIFIGDAFNRKDLYLANDDGTGYTVQDIGGTGIFVQCSSFSDINNDGDLDMFICADTSKSLVFHGDGTGALNPTYETLDPVSTVPTGGSDANSGNYGNVWSDFDLDGDPDLYISKCRQGIANPDDGRRLNSLFQNNGDGTYSEVSDSVGLLPRGQTWASDFADIDNDGDMDAFILNHLDFPGDAPSDLYENDGGTFTAISDAAEVRTALDSVGTGIQTVFADFDNDGYIDLLISSGGSGDHQILFNDGDGTFTQDNAVLPTGNRTMQSFAIGDLNNDGSVDIMAGFGAGFNQFTGAPDLLFLNPATDDNNWLKVHLTGVESNRSAVGAVIQITGSWGTQTREIRAGESYGISHSLIEHFGLGEDETVSMTITWPSGTVDTIDEITGNQTVNISEGCQTEFFIDADEDGFGDPETGVTGCIAPEGTILDGTDCDDDNENNFPGNVEVCDGEDNNCDGEADEGLDDCAAGSSSGGDDSNSGTGGESDSDGPTTDSESTTGPVDPTSDSDTEGDTDDSAGQGGGGGGCAVSTPSTDGALMLLLLGLGAPLVRRRKRC
ncbi:MAG: FG-GAP-like repeat-containing protein [Nannocystaceae bacterium]|nr:FG-GAP-like repeat-containing protein [bacterium]